MSQQHPRGRRRIGAALLMLSLPLFAADGGKAPAADPSAQPAEQMPRAGKSLLLDIARTPAGFIAVGERGRRVGEDARGSRLVAGGAVGVQ